MSTTRYPELETEIRDGDSEGREYGRRNYGRTDHEDDDRRSPAGWLRGVPSEQAPRGFLDRRRWVETKWSFKTTELLVLLLAGVGILVATWWADNLDAPRAWGYVTALAIGYMLARGLAKAGKGTYDDA
jgi:hypothetical protein